MVSLLSVHTRITRSRYIVKSYLPSSGSYINRVAGYLKRWIRWVQRSEKPSPMARPLDQSSGDKTSIQVVDTLYIPPQATSTPLLVFLCNFPNQLPNNPLLIPFPHLKNTKTIKLLTASTAQNAPPIIFAYPCSKIHSSK
jgi:hypothetical protein